MVPLAALAGDTPCCDMGAKPAAGDWLEIFHPAKAKAISNNRAEIPSTRPVGPVRLKFKRPPVACQSLTDAVL